MSLLQVEQVTGHVSPHSLCCGGWIMAPDSLADSLVSSNFTLHALRRVVNARLLTVHNLFDPAPEGAQGPVPTCSGYDRVKATRQCEQAPPALVRLEPRNRNVELRQVVSV